MTTKTEALRSEVREEVKERLGATREEIEEVKAKLNEEREKRLKLEKQVWPSTPSPHPFSAMRFMPTIAQN